MSVQRRSFYALKCERESCAEITPITELSLCGGMPFTIHTYFLHTDKGKNVLLEQEGVFCLSIENGYVTYTADKLGVIRSVKDEGPQLVENEWNQVDIVYTGEKLQIYIQGMLSQGCDAVGEKSIDAEKRYCIGNMNGYMDEVSIYSKALDSTEIFRLITNKNIDLQQIEFSVDFGVYDFNDTGKNGLKIQLKRNCNIINLIYAFVPSKNGYAIPFATDKTNPGSFETGEFTLLANVYPKTLTSEVYGGKLYDDETIIFANGTRNTAQNIALGMMNETNTVFLDLGMEGFEGIRLIKIESQREGEEVVLSKVKRIGQSESEEKISLDDYYVCGITDKDAKTLIWNGFLTFYDAKNTQNCEIKSIGLEFSTSDNGYVSYLCDSVCDCAITANISWIKMGMLPKKKSYSYR